MSLDKDNIREIPLATILHSPNSSELFRMYAEECSLPELGPISPREDIYENLVAKGGMRNFGAYDGEKLVGFATLLTYVVPHYGKKILATESIFVMAEHRARLGVELLDAIERHARVNECAAVLYSTPAGSRFSRFLSLSPKYRHTNEVYLCNLQ